MAYDMTQMPLLCRKFVDVTILGARMEGRDPVRDLRAWRTILTNNREPAPNQDLLLAEIDRALFELSASVPT